MWFCGRNLHKWYLQAAEGFINKHSGHSIAGVNWYSRTYSKSSITSFTSISRRTALIGRLRHRQNIDSFSIVDFVDFTIINDNYYGARKNCFACLLFKKPMHADLNNIISCLIKH